MLRLAKLFILYILRALGLFRLGRYLNRQALLILCYHGISIRDEHHFLPGMFVSPKTFAKRMRYVAKHYIVLSLETALKESERVHKAVITFDDGFCNFGFKAVPILKSHGFPATVYLSTYYMEHQLPIPNLMADYLIKRRLHEKRRDSHALANNGGARESERKHASFLQEIKDMKSGQKDIALRNLVHEMGFSYDEISESRMFHLLNSSEVRYLAMEGFDFQLHTHRHKNVVDNIDTLSMELAENKVRIVELTEKEPTHFAYPSGRWNRNACLQLKKAGVLSAATMDPGLHYAGADHLCLKRIFDSESNWQVEFEWMACGIKEVLYSLLVRIRSALGAGS